MIDAISQQEQQLSPLLALPPELQLPIYELAVTETRPLLLNPTCDHSRYCGRSAEREEDEALLCASFKRPPAQPALTRTCTAIRADALSMFYRLNTFHAHYCYTNNFEPAVRWLRAIGEVNRCMLTKVVLLDANPSYDRYGSSVLFEATRGLRTLGGSVGDIEWHETVRGRSWHLVTFRPEAEPVDYGGVKEMFEGLSEDPPLEWFQGRGKFANGTAGRRGRGV